MTTGDTTAILLTDAVDDWVPLHHLLWLVTTGDRTASAKAAVRDQLDTLFAQHLMVPGRIGDLGFEAWLPPSSAWLARALAELDEYDWEPLNEGLWLELTPLGRQRALGLMDESTR